MIVYLLYILFFLSCIVLIGSVLLQPGKSDAGALFTSGVSSTAFGARGTQTILSKITIGAASVFLISALLLALPAITGNISVMQTTSESSTSSTNTNTSEANANVSNDANANVANASANTNQTVANTTSNANTASNGNTETKKEEKK